MSKATPKTTLHSVTLQRNHTHEGKALKAGATIDVTETDRAWLIAHGVVADAPTTQPAGDSQ